MKKLKLKGYVLPTLYLLITLVIFVGVIFLGQDINLSGKDYDYSVDVFEEDPNTLPVAGTNDNNDNLSVIKSPVLNNEEEVTVGVHFYSKDDPQERQEQSLIYYENTYLPNTGVLYTSDDDFQVNALFDGKVTEILDDEFFGECVVVEHTTNLRSYYYGLDEIEVKKGDVVVTGTVLGKGKNNEIMNNKKTFLLEVYYNNEVLNPESFIGTKITDY